MQLPAELRQAYESVLSETPVRALTEAAERLSLRYRQVEAASVYIQTDAERLAYLAMRLPATYAAAHRVFSELQQRVPSLAPRSLLDLGAGSGAATWAAQEVFSDLQQCTLFEQDRALIALGQRLASHWQKAHWQVTDLRQNGLLPTHDVVIASYSLGELAEAQAVQVALRAWQAVAQALVLIEPGTMRGFGLLRKLRDALIAQGAHLFAPCPHAQACPLTSDDWCHFAARVERTALQRRLKAGALNYEDEKFAYLIFTREPHQRATSRVLRHPQRQAGLTQLQLCTPDGLQSASINKRDKEAWRRARKTAWGDEW
ncbi:MAG: rRNA methyltransferase [Acidobacteria bacterium]|nr:rRNA methyltransferase [Acidobacteriota bacterium]